MSESHTEKPCPFCRCVDCGRRNDLAAGLGDTHKAICNWCLEEFRKGHPGQEEGVVPAALWEYLAARPSWLDS